MLKTFSNNGYINYEPYKGIILDKEILIKAVLDFNRSLLGLKVSNTITTDIFVEEM